MIVDAEYAMKFPVVLREALIQHKVKFPEKLKREYQEMTVYRGVTIKQTKTTIDKSDFQSQIERKRQGIFLPHVDENDIGAYSCSVFKTLEDVRYYGRFPRRNKAIAKGTVNCCDGPILENSGDAPSHVHLFLYDDADPSDRFEVIEDEQKMDRSKRGWSIVS